MWTKLGVTAREEVIRARIDWLSTLSARVRMTDIIREYEALHAEGANVPQYALGDVASGYL